jgi:Skp family chaperone for outer membrane proteins
MLTPDDLHQIDETLTKRIKAELEPVRKEVAKQIKEEILPIREDITHIRKDIKTIVNYFDREYLTLRNRIERIEQHLGLHPIS